MVVHWTLSTAGQPGKVLKILKTMWKDAWAQSIYHCDWGQLMQRKPKIKKNQTNKSQKMQLGTTHATNKQKSMLQSSNDGLTNM